MIHNQINHLKLVPMYHLSRPPGEVTLGAVGVALGEEGRVTRLVVVLAGVVQPQHHDGPHWLVILHVVLPAVLVMNC